MNHCILLKSFSRCVLGEEKKKLAESILEQSLALPVGLKLDESIAPGEFTMDESNLDISHSLRLEDLTMMFGHHMSCGDGMKYSVDRKRSKQFGHLPHADIMSESECWSEPDRNVSLARIGLETAVGGKDSTSDSNKHRSRRSRVSYGSRSDEPKPTNDSLFLDEIRQLKLRIEHSEDVERKLTDELDDAKKRIEESSSECERLNRLLDAERLNVVEVTKLSDSLRRQLSSIELKAADLERQANEAIELHEKLRLEKRDLEATFLETERCLKRAADEATVQASRAALERARAQHERLRAERELDEAREQLAAALDDNSQLRLRLSDVIVAVAPEPPTSEEDRPTSPDQGIDSDRLSSLERNDALARSPRTYQKLLLFYLLFV